jgi:hypothetical protein
MARWRQPGARDHVPEPAPVALVGDLLATAKVRGAAAVLVDASVRDLEAGRARAADLGALHPHPEVKETVGELDVLRGDRGTTIRPTVVLDVDARRWSSPSVSPCWQARSRAREAERVKPAKLGRRPYDLDGLRAIVEEGGGT